MSVDKRNLARRVSLCLILCMLLGSFVPGWQAAAQDSTPTNEKPPAGEVEEEQPAADPTEVPVEVPTEEPDVVPTGTTEEIPSVDPTVTSEPTVEDVAEVFVNTDAIDLLTDSSSLVDPGSSVAATFHYSVTTPRNSTLITATLLDDSGAPAAGWSVYVDGFGDGTSTAVYENGSSVTPADGFEFSVSITAPSDVAADQTVHLYLESVALRGGDVTETGVADSGALFSATVIAPPVAVENTDTLVVNSDQPTTISESVDGVYKTTLTYSVTTDRASTTLATSLIDTNTGVAAVGWIVLVNGVADSYVDEQNTTAGSTFEVTLQIFRDESAGVTEAVATSLILHLSATSATTADDAGSTTPATADIGISVPALGGFEASNVVNNNATQNCTNDGGSTVALDSVAPFEVIEFTCNFFPSGLGAVAGVITTTATLILAPGWTIAAVPGSVTALGLPVLAGETAYASPSVVFTSVAVLPLNGPSAFKVRLRAPGTPLNEQTGSNVVTATVTSACLLLGLINCGNSVSTLGVTVDLTDVSSSGGALIGLQVLGIAPGTLLMDLQCDPPVSYTITPGSTYQANCSLRTTAALQALGVITLDGTLIGSASNGWQVNYANGHNATIGTGILNLDLGLIAASVIAGYEFTVFLTAPGCGSISGDPINAIQIQATYALSVLAINLPLSPSNSVLPFQVDGSASTALPSAAAGGGGLDFGQYEWDGAAYQPVGGAGSANLGVTISAPASGCVAPSWALNITANSSMSGSNGGSIAAGDLSYTGVSSGAANVTLNNPGSPITLGNVAVTPVTILSGTAATFAGPTSITASAGFTLAPPSSSQVLGTYTGSITVETSVAP